ncbi:MAG: homoserine dehydrogenase [Moraxellaceae bacterium]|nr:homoserine dehydrogenase [Moraxellaceae bacterium]MBP7228930.1 homoserine dehydrogenase [Moraxellaceae bacterium]MBP8851887.1 homoserine dehydrogenase [Moraxellaceae bacterium]MBP9045083.1 homoserine dehydrogenase [Moraxellaceae bacterium]MBP9729927.1 homoserine dehydrogenase [Moraxellaceae bacterium]
MKPVSVGIVGLGTVGGGAFNLLRENAAEISRRTGREIRVSHVGVRRDNPDYDLSGTQVSKDIFAVVNDPAIDIVVEVIGGTTTARDVVMQAIANGKHVVTANKALLAEYGNEIFAAAEKKGVYVAFEAAVAGGVPIVKVMREGLAANRIEWLAGIINGTGNFILSEMREKGRDFYDVLTEAQALGYAEADPTFDVEGIDAAHKLTILASLAFGVPLQFKKAYTEGITKLTREDVAYAEELGFRIKHLGIARRVEKGIELRVHPTLIPAERLIANVNGVKNAVLVQSDPVGATLYYGSGAGAGPTASSIVADIVDVVRSMGSEQSNFVPHLAFQPHAITDTPILPMEDVVTSYYLRLTANDRPGVLADVTRILSQHGISIEAILQKPAHEAGSVPVIILTKPVVEREMNHAIAGMEGLNDIIGKVVRIRLENLDA